MAQRTASKPQSSFKSFHIQEAIFEVRFFDNPLPAMAVPNAATEIQKLIEGEKRVIDGEDGPVLRVDESTQIFLSTNRFYISESEPEKNLKKFIENASIVYDMVIQELSVEILGRAGMRLVYVHDFPTIEDAFKGVFEMLPIRIPNDLSLSAKGKQLMPSIRLGWKDAEKTINYNIRGNSGRLTVNLPLMLQSPSIKSKHPYKIEQDFHQLIFDVDVFIEGAMSPGKLVPAEWLAQAAAVVKADGEKFFGE